MPEPDIGMPSGTTTPLLLSEAVVRGCDVLAKRWTPHLLVLLLQRPARFNELASAVPGLSKRVMTERLKELQVSQLVERLVDPGPPITSTYRLTSAGEELRTALDELCKWAERTDL